ncbi:DNA-binding response regulator [Streptomyces sp. UNOC14_S4]|uniref:DNA-binding response regulator n=1 Tax=Streptomyces sp. UNOC14_S4 TaxID=2872340 RepID=UPI001E4D3626|nr:DNA-binding response regulator [Streptomyces sp. UNOC14_S4]MCC3766388.1 DNA-binding response regulator [Streptomyces sp. UNOC14_S4]
MPDKRITVTVHATDELNRARFVRRLRELPEVRVVREDGDVSLVLMGTDDAPAAAELRRLSLALERRVVLVAEVLGELELMAVAEYGVRSVLWLRGLTAGRLLRAVHAAAGCCPRAPLVTALV